MVRLGIDLLDFRRFVLVTSSAGHAFFSRVYTENEHSEYGRDPFRLALCFSSKEAVSKVLGTGLSLRGDVGVACQDIEVLKLEARGSHAASINLRGKAQIMGQTIGLSEILSYCRSENGFAYSVAGGADASTIGQLRSVLRAALELIGARLNQGRNAR